ncbi:tyrosine-protein phosphatase [Lactococcus lactis]|nr:tyrosine-protein phosphatase [Lactococcus lactis]
MLVNFRDIQAQNSKESGLKKNIFFRGGQLTDLTAEDKKFLRINSKLGKFMILEGKKRSLLNQMLNSKELNMKI